MDKHEDVREKLERVLAEMLEHGGQVLDKVYLEMMISHLSGKSGEDFSALLKSPFLQSWVQRSLALVNTDQQSGQLYAFTLRLLALLMENEWQFLNIMESDVCAKIHEHLDAHESLRTPTVKLAHVQVLRAMLKHSVGTRWIIATKSWQRILRYCLENQTIYVVRESFKFVNQFTHKVASDLGDERLCAEVIAAITAPLDEAIVLHDNTVRVDSDDLQRTVMPSVKTLCYLMEYCIRLEKKSCVPHVLCKVSKCKLNLWRLTDMTKDEFFFKHIIGALALLNFVEYVDQLDNKAGVQFNQNQFGLHFFNHMKFCLVHRSAFALLSIAKMYHVLWTGLRGRVPEEIELEGNRIKFENQIITLQLTPIMFSIVKQRKDAVESELFDTYIMKLFDISTDHTLRVCYAFRELLTKNKAIVADVACRSIQGILAMKSLHRDRAVYVFQALSYTLKDFAYDVREQQPGVGPCGTVDPTYREPPPPSTKRNEGEANAGEETSDKLMEMPQFLSAILTGVHAMVTEHNITWKESIESMCLLNFMLLLLNKPNLSQRLTVQALKLTQLAVEHFLAPNLALLVENLKGSALENLGPTVVRRLHDPSWEVRDSALELLGAMATISVLKFPSFQQHILDHKLCEIVVQMAQKDSEAFVRASAINCLCPMVNVKRLWEDSLHKFDLMGYLLDTIHLENEGIVRKEYCLLITEIYRTYKIPNAQFELIFPTMAHIAVNDLYWEAKLGALLFWREVCMRQFKYHGVIDGQFPAVTFSKKFKKIVTLTPREIEQRLDVIMDELTARGALGVLLECLQDNCDLEVVKVSAAIATRLQNFLDQYGYKKGGEAAAASASSSQSSPARNSQPSTPTRQAAAAAKAPSTPLRSPNTSFAGLSLRDQQSPPACAQQRQQQSPQSPQSAQDIERVIASIVSLDDITLLGNTTVPEGAEQHIPEASSSPFLDPKLFPRMRAIKSTEYLRRVQQLDLPNLVERRGAWIRKNESIESLLDDMMFSLQIGDANNADCY